MATEAAAHFSGNITATNELEARDIAATTSPLLDYESLCFTAGTTATVCPSGLPARAGRAGGGLPILFRQRLGVPAATRAVL